MYEPTCADLCSDNLNKRWSTALPDLVVATFACSGGDSMLGRWEFNLASPFFKVYKVRSPAYFEDRNFKGVYTPTFEVVAQKRKNLRLLNVVLWPAWLLAISHHTSDLNIDHSS